jgi:nickel-dependent lactate racemase
MRVDLAFGKTGLPVDLPAGYNYQLLEARSAQPLPDQIGAIEHALDNPTDSLGLTDLARGKCTAAISVCDITRPAPNRLTLPLVLKRLEAGGIPRSGIRICIATGLHRTATEAELDEILSPEIARTYKIVNHNAKILSDHVYVGDTPSGTPVLIDRQFIEADLHITLGFIEPHLMLGFSGGRKLIAPGLAAQETIKVIHSPKFMRDPRAIEGSVADNPLHQELLAVARMARHDFLLDVALTRDRQVAQVFACHPEKAHAKGMEFVARVMLEKIPEPVDAVITTCAGYPLDLTFYQAVKGITAAAHIVKPGGRILVCAACDEGVGAPEFSKMLREHPSDREFLSKIKTGPVTVDQWQLEKLALVSTRFDLFFYVPGLPAKYYPSLWGKAFPTLPEAVIACLNGLPAGARVAVIPEGPYVLARAA